MNDPRQDPHLKSNPRVLLHPQLPQHFQVPIENVYEFTNFRMAEEQNFVHKNQFDLAC